MDGRYQAHYLLASLSYGVNNYWTLAIFPFTGDWYSNHNSLSTRLRALTSLHRSESSVAHTASLNVNTTSGNHWYSLVHCQTETYYSGMAYMYDNGQSIPGPECLTLDPDISLSCTYSSHLYYILKALTIIISSSLMKFQFPMKLRILLILLNIILEWQSSVSPHPRTGRYSDSSNFFTKYIWWDLYKIWSRKSCFYTWRYFFHHPLFLSQGDGSCSKVRCHAEHIGSAYCNLFCVMGHMWPATLILVV